MVPRRRPSVSSKKSASPRGRRRRGGDGGDLIHGSCYADGIGGGVETSTNVLAGGGGSDNLLGSGRVDKMAGDSGDDALEVRDAQGGFRRRRRSYTAGTG